MKITGGKWIVRCVAGLTALMGIVNVWSAINPALPERIRLIQDILPLETTSAGRLTTILVGFALLILASGLLKRKRGALIITFVSLVVSAGAHLVKGLDFEEALASLVIALLLFIERRYFVAKPDKPSVKQGIKTVIYAVIFTTIYSILGFYFLDKHFHAHYNLIDALVQTFKIFFLLSPGKFIYVSRFGAWFLDSIYLVAIFTLGYSFLALLRPVVLRGGGSSKDKEDALKIIYSSGTESLDYTALLPERHYYFNLAHDAFIAYKVIGENALSLGGPIGNPGVFIKLLKNYLQFCSEHGWQPTFFEVNPKLLGIFKKVEFNSILVGQEAVINLSTFDLNGDKGKHGRYAIRKLESSGYSFEAIQPSIGEDTLNKLEEISNEWLTQVHGSEKYFTVGPFNREYLRNCLIAIVENSPEVVAFTNVIKYGKNSLVIDLMRHKANLPPEGMLYLFVKLILWAKEAGYEKLSLGMASLYGVGENPNSPIVEKAFKVIFRRFNQFYNFRGLYTFKSKFHPDWEPRYICFKDLPTLSSALIALLRADSKEGILEGIKTNLSKKLRNK